MEQRITPAMVTSSTLTDLNSSLSALERTTEELSSGRKILEPSDNPYGASQVIDLQSELDGLATYASAAQNGIAWEGTASSAMASMNSAVQRVRELVVEAANGTNNQGDREAIAQEVEQLTETIKQEANTQYGGQYVFSGTATTTAPYLQGEEDEYQGNGEAITRAVGPSSTVTISIEISQLLGNGAASEDGKLLDTLRTIAAQLRGGTPEDLEALSETDLGQLDANLETLSSLQATAGSRIDQLEAAVSRNEGLQSTITQGLSSVYDANLAEASIAYANEQAAYEAALRAGATIVQESLLNFLQ
jgi:flagellar hook-associated protein 3 FlgL